MLAELETKSKKEVSYPSASFTFKNLEVLNPDVKPQTLRVRLKQALEGGQVSRSDDTVHNGGRGRAEYVYVVNVV